MTEEPPKGTIQSVKPAPKKRTTGKCCLGCLGIFVAAVAITALGVLLLIRNIKNPIDLGITSSPKDFENFIQRTGIELSSDPSQLCFTCPVKYEGEKGVDFNLNEQEASAWFNEVNNELGSIRDTQIKIEPDKVSISTNLNYEGVNYPVFASGNLRKSGPKTVKINLLEAKLGTLTIPKNITPQIEEALNTAVNQKFSEIPNFEIKELKLRDGSVHFKGTFPKTVSAL